MAQNVYEGLFILDSNRYARNPAEVSGKVPKLIEGQDGEMLVSRLWEERRLAYQINGQRKGTYWLTYFRMEGEKLAELTKQTERSDNIMRHLFLKVDPRIVDALVAHATAEPGTAEAAPAETSEKSSDGKGSADEVAKKDDAATPVAETAKEEDAAKKDDAAAPAAEVAETTASSDGEAAAAE